MPVNVLSHIPQLPKLPKDETPSASGQEQRLKVLETQGVTFEYLSGRRHIEDPAVFRGHIENFIGLAQVPVGVVGPLCVRGEHADGAFYVPMATTEGALVASYNRGAKLVTMSGGARVVCLSDRVSRAPGFLFADVFEAKTFADWCVARRETFQTVTRTVTRHGHLEELRTTVLGNHVYLTLEFTTGDAAGQNTATFATDAICRHIIEHAPVRPRHWFIESNLSGDKKATAISFLLGRGKNVTTEVVVPRELVIRELGTTADMVMEYSKMSVIAGARSGSIGVQGHYANALAAIFIACGQDAACVAEASVGITRVDLTGNGDLYVSVSLPNLIVGTVGGGTDLPTQRECLSMMGCAGEGTAKKFAEICAACVLAGEISITAAIAAGHFAQAHRAYGRKKA